MKIKRVAASLFMLFVLNSCSEKGSLEFYNPIQEKDSLSEKVILAEIEKSEKRYDSKHLNVEFESVDLSDIDKKYFAAVDNYLQTRIFYLADMFISNYPSSKEFKKCLLLKIQIGSEMWDYDITNDISLFKERFKDDEDNLVTVDQAELKSQFMHGWNNPDSLFENVFKYEEKYRGSEESLDFLIDMARFDLSAEMYNKVRSLVEDYYSDFEKSSKIIDQVPPSQVVGSLIDFSFKDLVSENDYSLSDFRGKLVVLDFWATWCGPCKASIPEFREIYNKYKDKVVFIGVSLDMGTKDSVKSFCDENDMEWMQYYEKNETSDLATKYSVKGIPTVFLVGKDGKIISNEARYNLESLIKENL